MANRPYQEKVDQFMADYQDKFLPSLVTGRATDYRPPVPDLVAQRMDKTQAQLERDKILAASIHPDTFSKVLDVMKGGGTIPSHRVTPGTPMSQFSNTLEGQRIMRERAIPIPGVSTGFTPPTGGGILEELKAAIPPEFARGGNVIDMTPGPTGAFEAEKPVPGGWDWRGELANQGTWSVGPERFFVAGKEVPAGTPGAVSGEQLAGKRIAREGGSAIPQGWNVSLPGGGSYWETPEMNARARAELGGGGGYEMPGEIKTALQGIQKILTTPTARPWSPQGYLGREGGYSKAKLSALENFAGTLEKMAATGAGYQMKMAEIGAEKPYREAMGDYYRRKAGVEEAALPAEFFERMARGRGYMAEAERPHAFPPNSAVYQGAKLLGYVPEKPEAIHPIIRDVINKSMMTDPNTGMQTGFDIRGARQKIGFMAPWLKAQGIDVPREAYKMTRPEFMAEQKAWVSRLPKKERSKYTSQYTNQLWGEYWGKD